MKLKAKGIGAIAVAGKPIGTEIALKFLDPILALTPVVIAIKDLFGSARPVRDDKAQVRSQSAHFDLDHDSSFSLPASGPVAKGIKDSDEVLGAGVLALS